MEAVGHYERVFWNETWDAMDSKPDVRKAIGAFFAEAGDILTKPEAPCGCVVVLRAINVPEESRDIADALKAPREEG